MSWKTPLVSAGSVEVRPASRRNLDEIYELALRVLPPTYIESGLLPANEVQSLVDGFWTADYFASALEDGAILWVAEHFGTVVGVAEVGRYGDRDAILWKLYVDAELRGQGLGARLLAAARAELWPGTERWFTEYVTGNQAAASFYAKHGFVFDRVEQDNRPEVDATYTWCVRDAASPIRLT